LTFKPSLGSFKVIGIDMDRSATYDFQVTFHSSQAPIWYRFREKRQFQSKIVKYSPNGRTDGQRATAMTALTHSITQ